eukprot:m.959653 g.959653  ORF g.959653 m.959653 type:complete len:126 (-) comp23882_c0_seq58:615-992(-)
MLAHTLPGGNIEAYSDQAGPPLIPYIFKPCTCETSRQQTYTAFVWQAMEELQANYSGLPMHGNTAILVPTSAWAARLRTALRAKDHAHKFDFVDARTGASSLAGTTQTHWSARVLVQADCVCRRP